MAYGYMYVYLRNSYLQLHASYIKIRMYTILNRKTYIRTNAA